MSFVLTASDKFSITLDNIVKGLQDAGFSKEDYFAEELPEPKLTNEEILQQLQVYTFTLFELVEFCFSESNKRLLLDTVFDFTLSEKVAFSHPLLGHFIFCTIITFYFN